MKSFADWTQEIAESQNMEPEPDRTDSAADGLGYACAHYGYVTCLHCGYDYPADQYVWHVAQAHPGVSLLSARAYTAARVAENLRKNNEMLMRLKL